MALNEQEKEEVIKAFEKYINDGFKTRNYDIITQGFSISFTHLKEYGYFSPIYKKIRPKYESERELEIELTEIWNALITKTIDNLRKQPQYKLDDAQIMQLLMAYDYAKFNNKKNANYEDISKDLANPKYQRFAFPLHLYPDQNRLRVLFNRLKSDERYQMNKMKQRKAVRKGRYYYIWWIIKKSDYEELKNNHAYPRDRGENKVDYQELGNKNLGYILKNQKSTGNVDGRYAGDLGIVAKNQLIRSNVPKLVFQDDEVLVLGAAKVPSSLDNKSDDEIRDFDVEKLIWKWDMWTGTSGLGADPGKNQGNINVKIIKFPIEIEGTVYDNFKKFNDALERDNSLIKKLINISINFNDEHEVILIDQNNSPTDKKTDKKSGECIFENISFGNYEVSTKKIIIDGNKKYMIHNNNNKITHNQEKAFLPFFADSTDTIVLKGKVQDFKDKNNAINVKDVYVCVIIKQKNNDDVKGLFDKPIQSNDGEFKIEVVKSDDNFEYYACAFKDGCKSTEEKYLTIENNKWCPHTNKHGQPNQPITETNKNIIIPMISGEKAGDELDSTLEAVQKEIDLDSNNMQSQIIAKTNDKGEGGQIELEIQGDNLRCKLENETGTISDGEYKGCILDAREGDAGKVTIKGTLTASDGKTATATVTVLLIEDDGKVNYKDLIEVNPTNYTIQDTKHKVNVKTETNLKYVNIELPNFFDGTKKSFDFEVKYNGKYNSNYKWVYFLYVINENQARVKVEKDWKIELFGNYTNNSTDLPNINKFSRKKKEFDGKEKYYQIRKTLKEDTWIDTEGAYPRATKDYKEIKINLIPKPNEKIKDNLKIWINVVLFDQKNNKSLAQKSSYYNIVQSPSKSNQTGIKALSSTQQNNIKAITDSETDILKEHQKLFKKFFEEIEEEIEDIKEKFPKATLYWNRLDKEAILNNILATLNIIESPSNNFSISENTNLIIRKIKNLCNEYLKLIDKSSPDLTKINMGSLLNLLDTHLLNQIKRDKVIFQEKSDKIVSDK